MTWNRSCHLPQKHRTVISGGKQKADVVTGRFVPHFFTVPYHLRTELKGYSMIYVFSGQGAQQPGMGKDLYDNSPAAKAVFDSADAALGRKLSEICFEGTMEDLTASTNCQPAIYTMSMACLAAFRERFPNAPAPKACAGLSLGEYGALACAGAFDFATGIKLLEARAKLMDAACQEQPGGMASVLGAETAAVEAAAGEAGCEVANYNCPGQIVISGSKESVEAAVALLKSRGIRKAIVLKVAGAFHSSCMNSAASGMVPHLAGAAISMPAIPVWHNYTAAPAADLAALKQNLADQISGSVRWEDSIRSMISTLNAGSVIEFGPGAVLTGLLKRTLPEITGLNVNSMESLNNLSF